MRNLLLPLLVFTLLTGCGSTGSNNPPPSPQPTVQRTDLLFGYYGDCDGCIAATKDHINVAWIWGWESGAAVHLAEAKAAGIPNIILGTQPNSGVIPTEAAVRSFLSDLQSKGLLVNILALCWMDEPEQYHLTTATVLATNAMLRQVMRSFPELSNTKLLVTYMPDDWTQSEQRPGMADFDIVSFDHYTVNIFAGEYQRFKTRTRAGQRILLFPGGANPWRQDPAPFLAVANADPQVLGIVAFIWQNLGSGPGIGSNGMAPSYQAVGRKVIGK